MKFLVISDTHGKLDKAVNVYRQLTAVDAIIHLGDLQRDGLKLSYDLGIDVISVNGNMDGAYTNNEFKILETECGKLLLTHGHMENVKADLLTLRCKTAELGCIAALFGHTHKPFYDEAEGLYLLNPGSLSLPADGTQGSYAIVNTEKEGFNASIVYYTAACLAQNNKIPPNKPKVQGGYLKNLLNNSDRF